MFLDYAVQEATYMRISYLHSVVLSRCSVLIICLSVNLAEGMYCFSLCSQERTLGNIEVSD